MMVEVEVEEGEGVVVKVAVQRYSLVKLPPAELGDQRT